MASRRGPYFPSGTAGAPSIRFQVEPGLGFYRYTGGAVGLSGAFFCSDTMRVTGAAFTTRIRKDTSIIDFTNPAESGYADGTVQASTLRLFSTNGQGITINTANQVSVPDGTAALPAVTFLADPDLGLVRSAANILGISAAGAVVAAVDSTSVYGGDSATGCFAIRKAAGTAAAPAFTFVGDTGNGIYRPAANQLGFSTNSAVRAILSNTAFTLQTGVALRLSNNYVAGAPAATGYVTVQDGLGGTMKLLCSNV